MKEDIGEYIRLEIRKKITLAFQDNTVHIRNIQVGEIITRNSII